MKNFDLAGLGCYAPSRGAMGLLTSRRVHPRLVWYNCRDRFHTAYRTNSGFLFASGDSATAVRKFLSACERRLKVTEGCAVAATTKRGIVHVTPGAWWSRQRLRLSLLTILLRCGLNYRSSLDEALFSEQYTMSTKDAVLKFFSGHTFYLGRGTMWVNTFQNHPKRLLCLVPDMEVSEDALSRGRRIAAAGVSDQETLARLIAQEIDSARKR